VPAFVVRGLAELVPRGVQVSKRVNHVALNVRLTWTVALFGASDLNQRNGDECEAWAVAEKSDFHERFRNLQERMRREFARGQENSYSSPLWWGFPFFSPQRKPVFRQKGDAVSVLAPCDPNHAGRDDHETKQQTRRCKGATKWFAEAR